jgi:heme/copper-type cytochrome/quinol oxidase subunit 3
MTAQAARVRKMTLSTAAALTGPRSIGWWAMLMVILNEAVLFAAMIASYFYLRSNSVLWPPQGVKLPELTLSSINTILLIGSSVVMQWALTSIRQENVRNMRVGLLVAFLIGAVFLGIQIFEYTQLDFTPRDHAYGSLFWSITGLHAAHVLAGLLMNVYVQVRAAYGHFAAGQHQAVENVTLYWHFVDVVWILIFVSLFLSPYL